MADVVVICTYCGALAEYDPPDGRNIWGVWHWHKPCKKCGANAWAAHDPNRDWKTGIPLHN